MMSRLFTGLATLHLGRANLLMPVLFSALLLTLLTLWSYRRTPMSGGGKAAALLLKLCGFYLLVACWLEPQWTTLLPKERANVIAFLLDDSRSMRLPDAQKGISRGERFLKLWREGATTWRADLERHFRTKTFTFSDALRESDKGAEPRFEGSPSALGKALSQIHPRLGQQPSSVVVFTDGVASDLTGLDYAVLPPVYPVVFGRTKDEPDVTLGAVSSTQSAFEDAPVTLTAEIRATGLSTASVRAQVELLDPPPAPGVKPVLAETTVLVGEGRERTIAQLQFEPPRSGPTFYKVTIACAELGPDSELMREKNTRLICVNRARGPHQILYVAGRPNWEFGPLRRALEADPELQLQALIRVAKREPKFNFKGRGGEASNPLFRGFQKADEGDVQRYDQPVIVRVNVENPEQLATGFPKTAEELFAYKGLILDHLEAEFFTPEQLRLLQRFVAERGGGLLMLGGMESFQGGGWQGTPVEAALPVWLGKETEQLDEPFQWKLTRDGLLEHWARRRKSEVEEMERTQRLPALEVLNAVAGVKPAASVLAVAKTNNGERPALVTQRYGRGRSAAVLAGDWFRWGLGDPANAADLAKLWRQIARWLVSDAPSQVDLSAQWLASALAAKLEVRVRNSQALPVEDADVEVRVRRIGDSPDASIVLHAEPMGEAGLYAVEYASATQGALVADAVARFADGTRIGGDSAGWVQDNSESEFSASHPDRAAMEVLAQKTGGELIEADNVDVLSQKLRSLPNLVMEVNIRPLWHTGAVFGLAVLCLLAEWFLRRRGGAA